jgi:hypothetical protein
MKDFMMKHYIAEGAAGSLGFDREFVIMSSSVWSLTDWCFSAGGGLAATGGLN